MLDIPPKLHDLLRMLHENQVQFVIVGGIAMRLHGSAHITDDVDISYARDAENFRHLATALRLHHGRLRGVPEDIPFIIDSQTLRNSINLTLTTDLGSLDLLGEPSGVDSFSGLQERSITMTLGGFSVQVASLDDLIAMKRAANRPKDQLHIMELEAIKKIQQEES